MSYLDDPDVYKAGLVIVGNEILTGRTQDKNTNWIAEKVSAHGISLVEVRIVTDRKHKIIEAVNALREEVDYVFTTGGIGPTHDDITAESIAEAFGVDLELNQDAFDMMVEYYGSEEETKKGSRQKMAMIPKGADLIHNSVSGAPGFKIGNVFVMAGVPRIMHSMFEYALEHYLEEGKRVFSNNVLCLIAESKISTPLAELQASYSTVEMGSYPHFKDGLPAVNLVLRSTEEADLKTATRDLLGLVDTLGVTPSAMSFQVMPDDDEVL